MSTLGDTAKELKSGEVPTTRFPDGLTRLWPFWLGLAILAALWIGPLPERARGSFAAHMVMHMGVVAIASPVLAIGLLRLWPALANRLTPALAILASFAEFAAVWTWHAPALHDAARVELPLLVFEQGSFLLAGLFVWMTAIGAATPDNSTHAARASGAVALLVTSMHMTLLGALLLLSPRPLYECAKICAPAAWLTPLEDQQLGGVVMLVIGGVSYLAGGLTLLFSALNERNDELGLEEIRT